MHLLQQLAEKGLIQEADWPRVDEVKNSLKDRPLHEVLIDRGLVREEPLLQMLA